MKINEIAKLTGAQIICGAEKINEEVEKAFSSDLMSDVLTINTENLLLITGLSNLQSIRTSEMADIHCILLVRSKKASPEMINLAKENGIVILETDISLFKASGILYNAGLNAVY